MFTRYSLRMLALTGLAIAPVGGCTSRNYNLRMHPMGVVDFAAADGMGHYPGDGGVVLLSSHGGEKDKKKYETVICVAPPSQAAVTVDSKGSGKLGTKAKGVEVDLEISAERGEDLARLFDQNERTLFVQTAMYRLCEAHANQMLVGLSWREALLMEAAALREEALESQRLAQAARVSATALLGRANTLASQLATDMKLLESANEGPARDLRARALQREFDEKSRVDTELEAASVAGIAHAARGVDLQAAAKVLEARAQRAPNAASISAAYWLGWQSILRGAVRLAEIDVAREVARADGLKAEAAKAKSDADKATADAAKAAATEALKKLQTQAVESLLARQPCCKDDPKKADAANTEKSAQ